jgi:hypothetical protein
MDNLPKKQSLLLTQKMCIDFINTYETQKEKNISDIEYLFLTICDYVCFNKISYFDKLSNEKKRFFVTKVKNILDLENNLHFEKSKNRMLIADEKKKAEDKQNNKINKYKVNFEKIKRITKFSIYRDDLMFILLDINKEMLTIKVNEINIKNNSFLYLLFSFLNYFLNNKIPETLLFKESYSYFVFQDMKKDIDKHEELYNTKIKNKTKGIK